jgi:Nitrile hydratase beta subunit
VFEVGQRVRTRQKRAAGHTRLPAYLQERGGRIVRVLGSYRFADEAAERGTDATPQMLYTVEFDTDGHRVCADLFESYLEDDA